jgi:hypothetical protein
VVTFILEARMVVNRGLVIIPGVLLVGVDLVITILGYVGVLL